MRILKQSHSAEKHRRRSFGLFETSLLHIKKSRKSHSDEKSQRRDPTVSSGFISYVKNGINERGALCTNLDAFPLAGLVVP